MFVLLKHLNLSVLVTKKLKNQRMQKFSKELTNKKIFFNKLKNPLKFRFSFSIKKLFEQQKEV